MKKNVVFIVVLNRILFEDKCLFLLYLLSWRFIMLENSQFSRTEMLIGKDNLEKLSTAKVAIFGLGGVRFFCCRRLSS